MKHLLATIILAAFPAFSLAQSDAEAGRYNIEHSTRLADVVVLGKVQLFDTQRQCIPLNPNSPDTQVFQVANIRIGEPLLGTKGVTHVRVGVLVGSANPCELKVGREGLFFLERHPSGEFYTLLPGACMVDASNKEAVLTARQLSRYLASPTAALQSADPVERSRAACILVQKYRIPRNGATKQVPIPVGESKLILRALAGAEWRAGVHADDNPRDAFARLGVSMGPTDFRRGPRVEKSVEERRREYESSAKAWLQANAETFRINRYE